MGTQKMKPRMRIDTSNYSVSPNELAWAAGFFDGEGCTTANGNPTKFGKAVTVRMSVAQVEIEPLLRFACAVGYGAVRGPYMSKGNKQPHFQWNVSGAECCFVLDRLWPYLGVSKMRQALSKIDRYDEYLELKRFHQNPNKVYL